ncbi:MAG: CvpA family protein [Clostridia bacterium]|nr:CvpA family protein [Clostridia bacterium]
MFADLILIILMALCIFLGYKRGLIKVAVRLLGFFAALIVALILYTPISNYIIENTEVVPNLKNTIETKLYTKEETKQDVENANIVNNVGKYIENYTEGIKENTVSFAAQEIAVAIVRILTWIGLFVGTRLLMLFIKLFTDAIAEIPVIKQFNKAGGTIYGILEGLVIAYAFFAIVSMAKPMIGENTISKEIDNSFLCKAMYENNLILKIIL